MSLDGVHHDVKSGGGGGIYETRPCREIRDQSVAYDKKRLTKRGKGKGGKIRGGPIPERTRPPRKLSGHAMRSQVGSLRFRNSIFLSFFFFFSFFLFFSFRKRVIPKFYYELLFLNDASVRVAMHFRYGNGVGVKTRITNRYSIEFQVNKPVCNRYRCVTLT